MNIVKKSKTEVGKKKGLPRGGTITHVVDPQNGGPRYNINFQTPAGFKVLMVTPINATIGDVLFEYVSVVGLGPGVIGKGIYFLFNGTKIKESEYNKTVEELGVTTFSHVIVVDTENLIVA